MARPVKTTGSPSRKERFARLYDHVGQHISAECPYSHFIIRLQAASEPEVTPFVERCPRCDRDIIDMVYVESVPPADFVEARERRAASDAYWAEVRGVVKA